MEDYQRIFAGLSEDCNTIPGLCNSARKVIGFTPIEPRMLKMQMENYGAKDLEEAKMMGD